MKYLLPKRQNKNEIKKFFEEKKLQLVFSEYSKKKNNSDIFVQAPYKPDIVDLYRLYNFIVLNKRITVVEFGTGWSTLIMAMALSENKRLYKNEVKNLRKNNPFELFVLENNRSYLNISKKRIEQFLKKKSNKINIKIHWIYTDAYMSTFNGHICTLYKKLPKCNPDFVYSDGPGQFGVKGHVNNFSTNHKDIVPIGADLLRIEYFLIPGTIILIDGRAANANFLKDNFKRKWLYRRDLNNDQHIFYLNDSSLGILNDKILNFYKNEKMKK